jgi:hypothetical protein
MQKIEIRLLDDSEADSWDSIVASSAQGTVFHTLAWLSAIEETCDCQLHRAIAYRGGHVVGVFPIFLVRRYGLSMLSSPPPKTAIPFLGPIYGNGSSSNRRKLESDWLEFTDAAVQFVQDNYRYQRLNLRVALPFGAARAFSWRGLSVRPSFTYVIPLERDLDEIRSACSSVIRRSISKCAGQGYQFQLCTEADVSRIYEQISKRYREQGLQPPYRKAYLDKLWSTIPRDRFAGFKLTKDGEYVTGMLCTIFNGTISFWSGLPRATMGGTYVNDFFHWKVIEWAKGKKLHTYDLVGANTANIAVYKSKFDPLLREYYQVTDDGLTGKLAHYLYRRFLS